MTETKAYFPGLDLLKFILALLILSIHVNLFSEIPVLGPAWKVLTNVAVPLFFAVSGFLFFRKVLPMRVPDSRNVLLKTLRRLVLLFAVWYILMLPLAYVQFFRIATWKETLFALLLTCTFKGYWFIKALAINTVILYLVWRGNAFRLFAVLSLLLYLFLAYNDVCHWISYPVDGYYPYYSWFYHLVFFAEGFVLAKYEDKLMRLRIGNCALVLLFAAVFALGFCEAFFPLFKLLSIPLLFLLFFRIKSGDPVCMKTLRSLSVVTYMSQFFLIWLYDRIMAVSNLTESWGAVVSNSCIRFVLTGAMCMSVGFLLLTLEKKPGLGFIRWMH